VGREKNGGAEGDRTPGLLIANQPLSQLSYSPRHIKIIPDGHYFKKRFYKMRISIFIFLSMADCPCMGFFGNTVPLAWQKLIFLRRILKGKTSPQSRRDRRENHYDSNK
jgi:hypothetical protein